MNIITPKKTDSPCIFRTLGLAPYIVGVLLVLAVIVTGCTDRDRAAEHAGRAGKQLSDDPLLQKIPVSTAGFAALDFSGAAYQAFSKSPYAISRNAKKSIDGLIERLRISGAGDELVMIIQRVWDSGLQLGIVAPDGTYTIERVLSRAVVFVDPTTASATGTAIPFDVGVFIRGATGVSMADKLDIIRNRISESKIQITDDVIAGASKGFSVEVPNTPVKIFFAANNELLGASTSKSTLQSLFASTNTGALEAIQGLPEYKQATAPCTPTDKTLAFSFISLSRLRPILDAAAQADESGQFKPQEIPFDGLAIQSSFPKQYVHNIGFAVAPKTEMQTKLFDALQGSALGPAATNFPADSALAIALDTRFLGKLEPMIKSIEEASPTGFADHAKKLESVTIGLRNNIAGSPLPDIFLLIESAGREQLGKFLESSLGMAMSLAGQNASWQTKEIEGTPTKFFTTLIGAGVYMSSPNKANSLLIGSSDSVVKDLISAYSGKSAAANASIKEAFKSQTKSANVASFYFNFAKVADVLDSAKNTLAMFTGGNAELNTVLASANIRSWGLSAGGISYTPGVLAIHSSFEAASK